MTAAKSWPPRQETSGLVPASLIAVWSGVATTLSDPAASSVAWESQRLAPVHTRHPSHCPEGLANCPGGCGLSADTGAVWGSRTRPHYWAPYQSPDLAQQTADLQPRPLLSREVWGSVWGANLILLLPTGLGPALPGLAMVSCSRLLSLLPCLLPQPCWHLPGPRLPQVTHLQGF